MRKDINLNISPKIAFTPELLKQFVEDKYRKDEERFDFVVQRRSIDARKRDIKVNLAISLYYNEKVESKVEKPSYKNVENAREVTIIGAGPAGYFAALGLLELGLKPVIYERGPSVQNRKRDIAKLLRESVFNENSNYGYGEGGAGAFSDGKLYTRSIKRGNVNKILSVFYNHGASSSILIDAHPHIGTDKLPTIISKIRETIIKYGGKVYFNSILTDIIIKEKQVVGIEINGTDTIDVHALILATGHSARDVYALLRSRDINMELKPFAAGIRVEHPQELIDSIQYHRKYRGQYLPAASYSFVEQVNNRGVFSFCMCPGGYIVPAKTSMKETVVNGMSPSMRNGKFANSGIVVELRESDFKLFNQHRELAGLKYQEVLEQNAFKQSADSIQAPAQRLCDFVDKKNSNTLPETSLLSGILPSSLHEWLPDHISSRLREAFKKIDRKARGFLTNDAIITGVESRTSSSVRIPRNEHSFQHTTIEGLFPCGEGAGYAGGIASSAIDGDVMAPKVAGYLNKR